MRLQQAHWVASLQPWALREWFPIGDDTEKGPLAMELNMLEMWRVSTYEARDAGLSRPDLDGA